MTAKPIYGPARTGLLFINPHNDFLSEGGTSRTVTSMIAFTSAGLPVTRRSTSCVLFDLVPRGLPLGFPETPLFHK